MNNKNPKILSITKTNKKVEVNEKKVIKDDGNKTSTQKENVKPEKKEETKKISSIEKQFKFKHWKIKDKPLPPPTFVMNHYKSTIGLFSKIYGRNDFKWRVGIIIIVGLLMSFTSLLFIQNTGVYISGTSGIFQGIARVVKMSLKKEGNLPEDTINLIYQIMFYVIYLTTNIPLIIFSFYKMGKKFTILSTIVVVLSNVVPLAINQIPGINNFFVFGDTRIPDTKIDGVYAIPNAAYRNDLYLLNFEGLERELAISMFLYALFAGLINGLAYSMATAVGGSTGGLDFISFFFAYKKKKPIGPILLTFNVSSVLLSVTLGSFVSGGIADDSNWTFQNYVSQNLMSGVIYTIVVITVLNVLFPKDKVVKIQIYCEDVMAIRNYLYSVNFNHSLTINTTTGGYSLQEKKNIEIICLYIEVPKIIRRLKEVKKDMMVTISPIKGIDGKLSVEDALN
ncbi:MAG: YitT family protein [Malacoplasma sp.]|nr:YitT family protein [Malacoplasma sp.]MDE7075520.1 YitT family protein [Malacoplasma sp.]